MRAPAYLMEIAVKKLSTSGLVAIALLVSSSAWAQLPTVITSTQPYQSLTGATVLAYTLNQDEGALPVALPFSFPYFGTTYTTIYPSINGYVTVGTGCTSGFQCYSNQSFPDATAPNAVIAAFWEDMQIGPTSQVRYVVGPSEVTVEWFHIQRYGTAGSEATFSIKLGADGSIVYHYGSITSGTPTTYSATIGFENQTATLGTNLLPCASNCTAADFVPDRQFRIGEPNEADLAVSSVSISNFVMAVDGNLTFDLQSTLRNFGRTPANNVNWKAYLSRDQSLDTTATDGGADIQVAAGGPVNLPAVDGGVTADGGLAVVTVNGAAATTVAPPTGEYFVLVKVDSDDTVMEASENNNVGSTPTAFVQGTDLVATSLSGPATTGGGNIEMMPISFFNRGTTPAGTVTFRILLSVDQVYDQSDFPVFSDTRAVSGGQTITETIAVTMPPNVPNGQFYYLLQVDPANAVTEANELNNVAVSSAKVDVRRADLLAEAATFVDPITNLETANARFGEMSRMKVRFRNTGGANANNFRVAMVLSTDSSLSLLSDNYACDVVVVQTVPSTMSTEVTLDCVMPLRNSSMMPYRTGQYFLFGVVDATGAVFESNKANNALMVGPIRITAPGADSRGHQRHCAGLGGRGRDHPRGACAAEPRQRRRRRGAVPLLCVGQRHHHHRRRAAADHRQHRHAARRRHHRADARRGRHRDRAGAAARHHAGGHLLRRLRDRPELHDPQRPRRDQQRHRLDHHDRRAVVAARGQHRAPRRGHRPSLQLPPVGGGRAGRFDLAHRHHVVAPRVAHRRHHRRSAQRHAHGHRRR
ncbi:MAG: CARDB domain-containing protein [Archangium sp.]